MGLTYKSVTEQREDAGCLGSWGSGNLGAACVGLLQRCKFTFQCADTLVSKTIARVLGDLHILNKKAKDKIQGQRAEL